MPDYERYLAHAAERHPGTPVLTRGDYFVQAIERKYGTGGARCCLLAWLRRSVGRCLAPIR
jgi:uncharacterized short protein YbdD (DUF466 family)